MASQQTKLMALSHHHNHQDEVWGAPGVKGKRVITIRSDGEALTDLIQSIIISKNHELKDNPSFYVLDLGRVVTVMNTWNNGLPNILPYYAVKCNPNRAFIGALASLGAGFDCATRAEIELVLSLGVSPDRIVYANPCKTESHIRYAAQVGVNLTTFDSKYEVDKIKKWHPKCGLLLRIKSPDDEGAHHPLGRKYGALPEEFVPLLEAAQAAKLLVHGVSFHVGSAATHSRGYSSSIEAAKSIFDTAFRLGMPRMHVINIGGGFTMGKQFEDASITIKTSIQKHFPNHESEGISLMSEPGRFFAETCFTLVTTIIGKRVRGEMKEYWISDGIYGSMNRLVYGFESMKAMPLACSSNRANPTCRGTKTCGSTVFGPTCDALDTLLTEYQLPELEVNDWLVWPNMGAYTSSAGSSFNGFNTSSIPTFLAYSNPPLN